MCRYIICGNVFGKKGAFSSWSPSSKSSSWSTRRWKSLVGIDFWSVACLHESQLIAPSSQCTALRTVFVHSNSWNKMWWWRGIDPLRPFLPSQSCSLNPSSHNLYYTRSQGTLQALTSSWKPFGPLDFVRHSLQALRPCDPRRYLKSNFRHFGYFKNLRHCQHFR